MINPVFWISVFFSLAASVYSLFDWKKGLIVFFLYIQVAGVLKRLMVWMGGVSNLEYNVYVGLEFVLLLSVVAGLLLSRTKDRAFFDKFATYWVVALTIVILFSIIRSVYPLRDAVTVSLLNYVPIVAIFCGEAADKGLMDKLKKMWVATAPVHALYEIEQFFAGPFAFEKYFLETKNSLSGAVAAGFYRGIPLYDNAEVLYIHFAIALVVILTNRRSFAGYLTIALILTATVMTGNRGGILIIFFAALLMKVYGSKLPYREALSLGLFLGVLFGLDLFGGILLSYVNNLIQINVGNSSFAERLGTLGTLVPRIVGRENALQNLTLLGLGFGTSGLSMAVLVNKGMNYTQVNRELYAHDLFGGILLDFGVVGAVVFFSLVFRVLREAARDRAAASESAIVISSILVSVMLGGSYTLARSGFLVWFFAGNVLRKRKQGMISSATAHRNSLRKRAL